jgi:hypothetical protein
MALADKCMEYYSKLGVSPPPTHPKINTTHRRRTYEELLSGPESGNEGVKCSHNFNCFKKNMQLSYLHLYNWLAEGASRRARHTKQEVSVSNPGSHRISTPLQGKYMKTLFLIFVANDFLLIFSWNYDLEHMHSLCLIH